MKCNLLLTMNIKVMNYTLGLEGLVPSALVFGKYPQVPTTGETVESRTESCSSDTAAKSAGK